MIERFVTVRGLRHHIVEREAAGPTVILLHGWLDHARIFDKLAAHLEGMRLLAPDLRGHGDTDPVGAGGYYHFFDYIADLHALVGALARPPVALVGHSMGGSVATYFAGAFPELVSHLCLIEGIGPPAMTPDDAPARVRGFVEDLGRVATRPPRRHATVEEAAARVREKNPRISADDALAFARHGTRPDGDGVLWKFDPLHQTRAPAPFLEELMLPFFRRITAPVLIVEGSDGFLLDDDSHARRLAAFPRPPATLRIPGAAHHVHLDAPAQVADALRTLLAQPG